MYTIKILHKQKREVERRQEQSSSEKHETR
jgi:hypothetical protein